MMSLTNGNGAGLPWDLDDAKWEAVQETTMSLRPQVAVSSIMAAPSTR
jgi:spermidine/putrescine transport system substrate-binding protein